MAKRLIIIPVYGGLVQDVFCDLSDVEVILVDFDLESSNADEPGVHEIEANGRPARVFVATFAPQTLDALAGTTVEKALDAAALADA